MKQRLPLVRHLLPESADEIAAEIETVLSAIVDLTPQSLYLVVAMIARELKNPDLLIVVTPEMIEAATRVLDESLGFEGGSANPITVMRMFSAAFYAGGWRAEIQRGT